MSGDQSIDNDFERKCVEWKKSESKVDFEKINQQIVKWTLDQPGVQEKKVIPEHFDRSSVKSLSKDTFKTKNNKYKYAESASTKFTDTYLKEETPSDLVCRYTSLFLMACKAKKWKIVMAHLKQNPARYPSLFKNTEKKHPLYHQDDHGTNSLLLALQSEQLEICQMMIEIIDAYTLKSVALSPNKTVLKYVTDSMSGSNIQKILIDCIESKIGKNKNNKRKNKKVKRNGSSCGFRFETLDPINWKCIQCDTRVKTNGDMICNNNHYQK